MQWALPAERAHTVRTLLPTCLLAAACAGEVPRTTTPPTSSTRTPTAAPNPWLPAAAALEQHCTTCHAEGRIAEGWPLTTHADAHRLRHAISAAVTSGAMPPWPAGPADLTYRDDRSPDAKTLGVLQVCLDADAPPWGEPPRTLASAPLL